ncbi:glycosyltransferase family 4 protein [Halodurantibacterium flavum]|uniref:Glycosyltransferase family 4 protein n=1 Tax=Halodurantibacterium flavum TaxID=1382802 RepID=A0ABW4S8Y4_9RHOB
MTDRETGGARNAAPPLRLLDLSRLLSRTARHPLTGIDRVELAYIDALLAQPGPFLALLRASPLYVLLDRAGAARLREMVLSGKSPGQADFLSRFMRKQNQIQREANSFARRIAMARCRPSGLARMLRRHAPQGGSYINVSHGNLTDLFLGTLREAGFRINILIHDTIPVDYPQFSTPRSTRDFADFLTRVSAMSDFVIYNSDQSRQDAERHFAQAGRIPPALVAHLGHAPPGADPSALPPGMPPARPYFVTVGTIEPRKNHALLLDIWDGMAASLPDDRMPGLLIVGSRGWKNEEVFRRLDTSPLMGRHVHELSGLTDGGVMALMQGAHALLFPSFVEGFGLPVLEAASIGLPAVCCDLPIYREFAGDYPVYLDPGDQYVWRAKILELAQAAQPRRQTPLVTAGWARHFDLVLPRV